MVLSLGNDDDKLSRIVQYAEQSKTLLQLKMLRHRFKNKTGRNHTWQFTFFKSCLSVEVISRLVSFQRTVKKCTKIHNARAQPLFYLLQLLLAAITFIIAVVVSLSSLFAFQCTKAGLLMATPVNSLFPSSGFSHSSVRVRNRCPFCYKQT